VYLAVWRKIDRAPAGDEALPWMYGVARNVVRNSYRSTSRRSRLHQKVSMMRHESPETPETQIVRNARDEAVLAAVGRLTPHDQELVRLRTWEELSHAQIATVTGLSVRSVESKLARSRKKLERLLDVPSSDWVASPRPTEKGGER
jgi:RNA polymerase sigma-70 factor (ECF subfamily)